MYINPCKWCGLDTPPRPEGSHPLDRHLQGLGFAPGVRDIEEIGSIAVITYRHPTGVQVEIHEDTGDVFVSYWDRDFRHGSEWEGQFGQRTPEKVVLAAIEAAIEHATQEQATAERLEAAARREREARKEVEQFADVIIKMLATAGLDARLKWLGNHWDIRVYLPDGDEIACNPLGRDGHMPPSPRDVESFLLIRWRGFKVVDTATTSTVAAEFVNAVKEMAQPTTTAAVA